MLVRALWLAKGGNNPEEYEDAFAIDPERGSFAVADGATDSSFACLWARLLVTGFVAQPVPDPKQWLEWLPCRQQSWVAEVGQRPLPWYAEAKLQQGAFATFLGVVLCPATDEKAAHWQAIAVGDSCLFQVRANGLRRAFPLRRAVDFGVNPWLVGSGVTAAKQLSQEKFRIRSCKYLADDQLWLMTDALACWFLRQFEAGDCPWEVLGQFVTDPAGSPGFAAWVEEQRDSRAMRNDDVTLVYIQL